MERRKVLAATGITISIALAGCLDITGLTQPVQEPDDQNNPVGTEELPTRVWLAEVAPPENRTIDPIVYHELSDAEKEIIQTVLAQGEYTAATDAYTPALDEFRDRIETRTNGGQTLKVYLSRKETYYRIGFAEGDHIIAHPDH